MKKILSFGIVAAMVCVSFSLVSWDAASEDVTGPFAWRNTGYPTSQVVDQENPTHDGVSTGVDINNWISQTFAVGTDGDLTSVGVWLEPWTPNRALNVQIWTADGSDTPVMAIGTPVAIPSVDASGWLYVGLNEAIPVTAGQKYALVLSSNDLQVCYWMHTNSNTYINGVPRTSSNQGGSWSATLTYDFTFRTFMGNLPGTIKKVAWHSSGSFALGVTGSDPMVHRYDRVSGSWSPFLELNLGEVMNDIVFDAQPGYDRFYFVGRNTNNGEPLAYEFQYDPVGGSNLWPKTLGGINGTFYGVEHSNDGVSSNKFLAVGQNFTSGGPLAYWYDKTVGWKQVSSGLMSGDILTDVCWDRSNYYYAVGRDGSNRGVVYRFTIGGNSAAKISIPAIGSLNAIDWSPASISEDYAVMVGEKGTGPGNVHTFDRADLVTVWTSDDIFNDIDWHPPGDMAVIVGSDNTGTEGVVVLHYPGADTAVSCTHLLPAGAPPFYGVAVKGPTSPSSAIITGTGGGIAFYQDAVDQDTTITVNSAFPRLYWIGFNDTATEASLIEQPVNANGWYQFSLAANYSLGWSDCEVIIEAWHDRGNVGDTSAYPDETDENRALAFRLHYDPSIPAYTMTYPGGPEFAIGGYTDTDMGGLAGQEIHELRFEVWLGPQTRNADGNGFASGDSDTDPLKNNALLDANSWDFNVTVRDRTHTSAYQSMFSEFGINKLVSITAAGNPSGNAPPGAANVPLTTPSRITYSSNSVYWLNISIPNVGLGGDPLAIDNIPATDVFVANTNILASRQYTELNSTDFPTGRAFQGADVPWCVWGNRTEIVPYMPAPGNGTTAFGPWGSNFNLYDGTHSDETWLSWWVTVQPSVREGVYWAIITITIKS